jgi:NADH dehydrogenase
MIVMGKMKIKLKGRLAWYMHRGYHGMAMPTWNRKIRVFADWTLGMFLKREVVSLGAMENPREEFYEAAKPAPVAAASTKGEKAKAS